VKRSKTIEIMVKAINAYRDCYRDSPEYLTLEQEMDYILFKLELIGMLPPDIYNNESEDMTLYEWEKE